MALPVLPLHAQHLAQQHDRFQQIVVMDDPPMAVVVECPIALALRPIVAAEGGQQVVSNA